MSEKTTILLADDHQLLREGLRGLLDAQPELRVVGEAGDGRTAVKMALELEPEVVILDVSMPELNGIEATRQIVAALPKTRVLSLSMHTDRQTVVEALRAGASGYLAKMSPFQEMLRAVRTVAAGQRYLSQSVAGAVMDELLNPGAPSSAYSELTSREREVLQLLAEGKSSKEIASALSISSRTVDVHRKHLMDKLELRSAAQLTLYAVKQGLVSLDD
ncbi:MAG TPA: response regulator transcription factor [Polyangiaceae bacterium]|nr:response regulator transcription factor [Polyangiaceae bacterium]